MPIPIIVYNIPSRTGVNITPDTMAKLSKIKNIVGVKEAAGSLQQMQEMITACGPNFSVLSGDDFFTFPLMCINDHKIISVASNVAPAAVAELVDTIQAGKFKKAKELHYKLTPLVSSLFVETNPAPVKAALSMMGMMRDELRLPLIPLTAVNREKLRKELQRLEIIR